MLLLRAGGLFLASELTIHGVVILYRQTAEPEPLSTVQLAAGSQIIGALVSQHSLSDPSVIERVIPAPERLLSMFESGPFPRLVSVCGRWEGLWAQLFRWGGLVTPFLRWGMGGWRR